MLLILESPSKCATVSKYLDCKCVATCGHLQTLESVGDDFIPVYKTNKKQVSYLKPIISGFTEDDIYLACDDDREGEAICWQICELFGLDVKKVKRIKFHEITKSALLTAVANPTVVDLDLVSAQKTRQIIDWLVGFKISPTLWKNVSSATALSAGRCQTPALRLVVEREDKIHNFKVSTSWQLQITWIKEFTFIGNMELEEEESVLEYMESVYNIQDASIISKEITPWSEKAPEPKRAEVNVTWKQFKKMQ